MWQGSIYAILGIVIAFGNLMEMRDAEQHKLLNLESDDAKPAPIPIIDEFSCDNNQREQKSVRTLFRNASAKGPIVLLMPRHREWAPKLIDLNGGTRCKPLHCKVDNEGRDRFEHFVGNPEWNDLYWTVKELRQFLHHSCVKYINIKPEKAIPDQPTLTPGEVKKIVMKMRLNEQLK